MNVNQWIDKVVEKEYHANPIYKKNGSWRFGACVTVAERLEKAIPKTKDDKKRNFLVAAYKEICKVFE